MSFLLDFLTTDFQCAANQGVCINEFEIELQFAFAHSGEVEKVINEPRFEGDVAVDHLQRLANRWRSRFVTFQERDSAQDGTERRAQLVAQHGEELVLGAIGLFSLFPGLLRFGIETGVIESQARALREFFGQRKLGGAVLTRSRADQRDCTKDAAARR